MRAPSAFAPAALAAASLLLVSACAATSGVARERTELTPAQIAEMGLECRRETGTGTNIPRSVCASPESWDRYEAATSEDTQRLFDELGKTPNDRFNNRLGTN